MGLNHAAIYAKIKELTVSDLPVSVRLGEVIQLCSSDVPHESWSELSNLDYDRDVNSLASWIPDVFKKEPAPFPIKALWVGLSNPSSGGVVWADMSVAAMGEYDSDDVEYRWLWKNPRHYPTKTISYARSSSLRRIYEIGYVTNGLGNSAEWPLCLAFAAFATRTILGGKETKTMGSVAPCVGVMVGFDDGDMLKIGDLTDQGEWI